MGGTPGRHRRAHRREQRGRLRHVRLALRVGGTAITTRYVADVEALASDGVSGINFALVESSELLDRVADALLAGRIVVPPITTRIALDDAPAALSPEQSARVDGTTGITL
jgi:hypothetical protein